MKKKLLLTLFLIAALSCILAILVSAATTNEFGTPETVEGIDLTGMNEDRVARIVLVNDNGEYHTYFTGYVLSNNTKFKYNFVPINNALGTNYSKNSVVRIEVPDNIEIAANCGDLSSCNELLEIKFFPTSELHTLEYGCFYNNKKLLKLNIPKKVQTMGTLLINSSSKLEELVFDDGFCAVPPKDSFIGAKNLKKVVFSNQMTTVHRDSFFDSFTNVKEIYLGESLVDIGEAAKVDGSGSDGGNFSYTDGPIKIYASSNLFASIDTIERGRLNGWTGNRLVKGVLFYTGTKEQAQALIDKAADDTPIFNKATLVEWDSSLSDDEYMPANNSWNIVYGYNVCKAFYSGEHQISGGDKVLTNDLFAQITVGNRCAREDCGVGTVTEIIEPIFVDLGVSVTEFADKNGFYGITKGYMIDMEAYGRYLSYKDLEFGVVVSVVSVTGKDPLTVVEGEVCAKMTQKTAVIKQGLLTSFDQIEVKLVGLSEDNSGTELVMGLFAFDGKEIAYLDTEITFEISK